jgi:hypothetical protein
VGDVRNCIRTQGSKWGLNVPNPQPLVNRQTRPKTNALPLRQGSDRCLMEILSSTNNIYTSNQQKFAARIPSSCLRRSGESMLRFHLKAGLKLGRTPLPSVCASRPVDLSPSRYQWGALMMPFHHSRFSGDARETRCIKFIGFTSFDARCNCRATIDEQTSSS